MYIPNNQKTKNSKRPILSPIFNGSGRKSEVAAPVWERFGNNVKNFKDPFCNTASILIGRTLPEDFERGGYIEQINDADGLVVNALRAIQAADPKELGELCERAYAELDLIAAHWEFVRERGQLVDLLKNDINKCDWKLAALFIWASRGWIGGGMGNPAVVINKKIPSASIARFFGGSAENHIRALQQRFRRVQIFCGDGISMIDSKTQLTMSGITATFIDPPYSTVRRTLVYTHDDDRLIARNSRVRGLKLGALPNHRVACCGFFSRYDQYFPADWERFRWKPRGGRHLQGNNPQGYFNADDECIWFSPGCLKP